MTTRLRAQFPDLADALEAMAASERAALVERVASEAASIAGVVVPDGSTVAIGQWAAELDEAGWTIDSAGDPAQDPTSFRRARAAFAVRDARAARERPEAAAESLYESVVAMGPLAVRAHLA
jgi:hypothetical protein